MMVTWTENQLDSAKLAILRHKIDNADYLHEAIQRIALILSNELLETPGGGIVYHERKERK
jgi:hypothetical protein